MIVRIEGSRQVRRRIQRFSLDVIISVGYRVKSVRGTQFRIWANGILRNHLLRGYTLNAHRFTALGVDAAELVELITRTLSSREMLSADARGVLEVANRYALTWTLLRAYDEGTVPTAPAGLTEPTVALTVEDARAILRAVVEDTIATGQPVGLFGLESGDRLEAALMSVEQTWDGQALYATVESRAAHLLYFLVKDHPLADGNKRAGALLFIEYLHLFIEYLHRNGALMTGLGEPRIANTTLAALTLMIAESSPDHMDFMIRLVLNVIAGI